MNAAVGVLREGRLLELAYGGYCMVRSRPSSVVARSPAGLLDEVVAMEDSLLLSTAFFERAELVAWLSGRYAVDQLPEDFEACRMQTIAFFGGRAAIGEYGWHRARIAIVSRTDCRVFTPYLSVPGVRHIHLIRPSGVENELIVTTGDGAKVLDRWVADCDDLRLRKRHRARLAGHTAMALLGDEVFLGSDFSSRPNYLETLDGKKYFFPARAYAQWALSLTPLRQRYLVAINADFGDIRTVSIFDTRDRVFVFCAPWTDVFESPSKAMTSGEALDLVRRVERESGDTP